MTLLALAFQPAGLRLDMPWWGRGPQSSWGVGLLLSRFSRVRLPETPWTAAPRPLHPWDFPGKSTGVGCQRLLPGGVGLESQNSSDWGYENLKCLQGLPWWSRG